MRIWFKMMKGTHLIKDMTVTDESDDTRTHKIFKALDEVCYAFDLGKPIWLDANVEEFKKPCKYTFIISCIRRLFFYCLCLTAFTRIVR